MWQTFKNKVKAAWQSFWDWCKNSGTILLARLEVTAGVVITAITMIDWTPLITLGAQPTLSVREGLVLGLSLLIKGVLSEVVRRRGTVVTPNNNLIPAELPKTDIKKIEIK